MYKWRGQLYEYYHCHGGGAVQSQDSSSSISDTLDRLAPHNESVVVSPVQPKPTVTLEPLPTIKPLPTEEPMPSIILPPTRTSEPKIQPVEENNIKEKVEDAPSIKQLLEEIQKNNKQITAPSPILTPAPTPKPSKKSNFLIRFFQPILIMLFGKN